MMASFMSYFGAGRKDPKQTARDAIVGLRQQLQMIEKKEEYLQKKIEEETKKAKANAVTNKAVATAALKRKKMSELELDRLSGSRLQLEMQVNTLESANLNAETMAAMKKASDALKVIHGNLTLDKVDSTMNAVNEQRELANEVAEALANPIYGGAELDDVRPFSSVLSAHLTFDLTRLQFLGRAKGGARGTTRRGPERAPELCGSCSSAPATRSDEGRRQDTNTSCGGRRRRGAAQGVASSNGDVASPSCLCHVPSPSALSSSLFLLHSRILGVLLSTSHSMIPFIIYIHTLLQTSVVALRRLIAIPASDWEAIHFLASPLLYINAQCTIPTSTIINLTHPICCIFLWMMNHPSMIRVTSYPHIADRVS